MVRSRVFGFLAIAMLLAACLCVSASSDDEDEEQETKEQIAAEEAVEAVEELAKQAEKSATELLKEANSIRSSVQSHRTSALNAKLQTNDIPNDNTKAAPIAVDVQATADRIISRYNEAHEAAEAAVKSMTDMVTKAKEVVAKASIDVKPSTDTSNDYTLIHTKVSQVNASVKTFQTEMEEKVKILQSASNLELEMSGLVEKVQLEKNYLFATLSVTKIDTILQNADVYINKTENKKDEVNNALEEIKKMSKEAPQSLTAYVSRVTKDAESALVTASREVEAAKRVKVDMMQIKRTADAVLENLKSESNLEKFKEEVQNAKRYAAECAKKASEIANALKSAELTARIAESRKQSFIRALSTGNPQPIVEETKYIKEKSHSSTKDSPNGLRVKSTINNFENTVQQASEKLTGDKRKEQKVKNTKTLKDNLPKGTNNEIKTPLVDGNFSPPGFLSDGAMLVSVPLLVALIASAVLA